MIKPIKDLEQNKEYLVGVFGTLKEGYGNHSAMERANGTLVNKEDWVEFKTLENVGFPISEFKEGTGQWLHVEVYKVKADGILGPLDSLEGYPHLYDRIVTTTLSGKDIIIYRYGSPNTIVDMKDKYLLDKEETERLQKTFNNEDKYYRWDR